MNSRQYTIRSVPDHIDSELRRRAQVEHKTLNAVILESLERALGLQGTPAPYTDLDALIGTWEEDPAFDEAIAGFEQTDRELWQ